MPEVANVSPVVSPSKTKLSSAKKDSVLEESELEAKGHLGEDGGLELPGHADIFHKQFDVQT